MVAMFSGGTMELALALGLNINSVSYTFNGSLSPTALSPTFNITNLDDGNLGSGTASGMFVGANAQYVGVSYTVTPYNEPSVVGAAALGR